MNTFKLFKVSGAAALALSLSLTSCDQAADQFQPDVLSSETTNALAQGQSASVYVSSNTTPVMGVFNVTNPASVTSKSINVGNNDSDGIYFYPFGDAVFQLDRSTNVLKAYNNVSSLPNGATPAPSATSPAFHFTNGREIAFSGGRVIVAQDADPSNSNLNKFLIYRSSPFSLNFQSSYTANINLWGLHASGENVYAVEDNSGNLAYYSNFFNKVSGSTIMPDWKLAIAGLVRTHGITYDEGSDIMVLTDVGDAASATDGAVHIITNFSSKAAAALAGGTTGTIALNQQIRIAGSSTLLGNPVDVAFSTETNKIYVAERLNGGGRLLIFDNPASNGNPAPIANVAFAGASAIFLKIQNGSAGF